ncbi:site-specific recombinase for integration and excision [Staphylococcus gallinarum]|uniref:Site-specific recombinase for integration and excision n=1 Tax=Staphylococcus gallinarum TaxID=1293 RepID=A0A380FIY6_STAGA|nr:site-specific recombinase for integration and excision [Staphylococcus gallinarum]
MLKVFHSYLKQFDLNKYMVREQENKAQITVDIDKVMEQRKRYHKLFASGLMQEEELFDLIKETDVAIAQYEKEKAATASKEFDVRKIEKFKDLLLRGWEEMTDEDKSDFIKMSIKKIDFKYKKGIRGKRPNSLTIKDIEFY